jgi:hypothetical protein
MAQSIFKVLPAFVLSMVLFSCSQSKITPSVFNEGTVQAITAAALTGKYKLSYTNTASNRTWVAATSVGLQFFTDTYLYTTGYLDFDPGTLKVSLSSISPIASLPDVTYGSCPYTVNGENLIIVYNQPQNNGQFKVVALKAPWLILEDTRTKTRWAFYKK